MKARLLFSIWILSLIIAGPLSAQSLYKETEKMVLDFSAYRDIDQFDKTEGGIEQLEKLIGDWELRNIWYRNGDTLTSQWVERCAWLFGKTTVACHSLTGEKVGQIQVFTYDSNDDQLFYCNYNPTGRQGCQPVNTKGKTWIVHGTFEREDVPIVSYQKLAFYDDMKVLLVYTGKGQQPPRLVVQSQGHKLEGESGIVRAPGEQ